jgi:hypothetical protein
MGRHDEGYWPYPFFIHNEPSMLESHDDTDSPLSAADIPAGFGACHNVVTPAHPAGCEPPAVLGRKWDGTTFSIRGGELVLNLETTVYLCDARKDGVERAMAEEIHFTGEGPSWFTAQSGHAEAAGNQVTLLFKVARQDEPAFHTAQVLMTVDEATNLLGRLQKALSTKT